MAVSLTNPEGHVEVPLYHHVAVATGTKQVFIAGQVAWDAEGNLVAADLAGASMTCGPATAGRPSVRGPVMLPPCWATAAGRA